jgi:rubrerythrin
MTKTRFRSLADVIGFAIAREIEAAEGYAMMTDLAKTPGLRELLIFLRIEEESHRRLLEGLSEDMVQTLEPASVPDLRIVDSLAEEKLSGDMSLQDLLVFAAKKESRAAELYESLARTAAPSGFYARIFRFLAGQERDHKLRLEAEYERHFLQEN